MALLTGIHSERIGRIEGLAETPTFEEIRELSEALQIPKEKLFPAEILNEISQKYQESVEEVAQRYIGPKGWEVLDINQRLFVNCNYCW